jgi:hypothetical protein
VGTSVTSSSSPCVSACWWATSCAQISESDVDHLCRSYCPACIERFFEQQKPPDSKGDCKLCRLSIKKHKIRIMIAENDMDPFPYGYPDDFVPMLTPIETMLISPAYPFMKVYTFANGAA